MGCNTSKEAVSADNQASDNHLISELDNNSTKDESGGRTKGPISQAPDQSIVGGSAASDASSKSDAEEEPPPQDQDIAAAATKIQALFRGHQTRKAIMKQPEPEPTREELEDEFRADDVELCHAATKIQATFRGHMTRKQNEKKDEEGDGSSQANKPPEEEEELDIDLSDPELNKAAIKIQASFRGHMVRKDEGTQ